MKRIRLEVRPDSAGSWKVTRDGVVQETFSRKAPAVQFAAGRGRALWAKGQLAQLHIKGRDGRIQDERTYGRDPRRSKG